MSTRRPEYLRASDVQKRLQEKGFQRIGSGNFTTVFARPGDQTVIRVGSRFSYWEEFAATCRRSNNPHLPRIYRLGTLGDFLIARVERLKPITESELIDNYFNLIAFICLYGSQELSKMREPNPRYSWTFEVMMTGFEKLTGEDRSEIVGNDTKFSLFKEFLVKHAHECSFDLMNAVLTVRGIGSKRIWRDKVYDYKAENFMRRSDNTLVINDPIW